MTEQFELIITEKPKVSQRIAEALADGNVTKTHYGQIAYYIIERAGQKIIVAPAVGHIFTLKQKAGVTDYPIFDIEWVPSYEAAPSSAFTKAYLETLQFLGKGASSVVCACDYDLEGELIGYNIVKFLMGETALKHAKRMKFSELTREALQSAYDHKMAHLDFQLADAGTTRHILDWYWGINTSRALSHAYKSITGRYQTLSAGRVQTPTLKVLADREKEIKAFIPEPFWVLTALVDTEPGELAAVHETDKFFDEAEAKKIHDKCKGKHATVSDLQKKRFKQNPPVPFNLGDLQSESYHLFKYTPQVTQSIAQSLYDTGLISYPRTSSQKLPAGVDPKAMLKKISAQAGYKPLVDKIFALPEVKPNEGSKTDPAHPCIYPTGEVPKKVNQYEQKLYDLIVKRFLACFGEPAVRESQQIDFSIAGEKFLAKGTRTVEKHWHELYEPYIKLEEEELPALVKGKEYKVKKLSKDAKETQPPKRYSPASIVKKMEDLGIGTKATRATILQTLYDRNYITGTQIEVTEFGLKIVEILVKYVPELTSEEMTRAFEEYVEKIETGKIDKDKVLGEAQKELVKIMDKFKGKISVIAQELVDSFKASRDEQAILGSCPKCKTGNLIIRRSRASGKQFVGCSAYPKCHNGFPLPQMAKIEKTDKVCEHDGLPIVKVIRRGKRPFTMCIAFGCPSKANWGKKKAVKTTGTQEPGKLGTKKTTKRTKKSETGASSQPSGISSQSAVPNAQGLMPNASTTEKVKKPRKPRAKKKAD